MAELSIESQLNTEHMNNKGFSISWLRIYILGLYIRWELMLILFFSPPGDPRQAHSWHHLSMHLITLWKFSQCASPYRMCHDFLDDGPHGVEAVLLQPQAEKQWPAFRTRLTTPFSRILTLLQCLRLVPSEAQHTACNEQACHTKRQSI